MIDDKCQEGNALLAPNCTHVRLRAVAGVWRSVQTPWRIRRKGSATVSALNVDRAVDALNRLLKLDQEFRLLLTRTVNARGHELDQCEARLKELDPQLRRAQEDLTKLLLTLRDSYRVRVAVPVRLQETSTGCVGVLSCGCADAPRAEGSSPYEVIRLLQTLVDAQST